MSTELICFFLLGIAALLLNAGLSSQALPLFWLVLSLAIKHFFDTKKGSAMGKQKTLFVLLSIITTIHLITP